MSIECRHERGRLTVFFKGDIDEFACRTLRTELDAEMEREKPREVVFDLKDVSFVDSTGLGLILGRYKKLSASGGVLRLKDVPPHSTVVGVPGRVVRLQGEKVEDLDQQRLPDPVRDEIDKLRARIEQLEKSLGNGGGEDAE